MSQQIVVFPRGQLTAKDKERLTKAGIVAVEADDPSKVVCVLPAASMVGADDLLMSLLAGLTASSSYNRNDVVVAELQKRLKAREAKKETP